MILNFAGDVVLADLFERYGVGIGSKIQRNSYNPFFYCKDYLGKGDVNIINLESVLSNNSSKKIPWSQIMRGLPESINLLKNNSIHAVNLANNHSLDHGREAFNEMTELLDKSGIVHFGGPRDEFQESPVIIIREGLRILIFGYYLEESLSSGEREKLLKKISDKILEYKKDKNLLVLSLHWGSEYSSKPFLWMITWGKILIENGVDILYGHHSHTYQGVAIYHNSIFAPGMGNFIFDDCYVKNRRTALLQVIFSEGIFRFNTIPLFIDKYGSPVSSIREKNYIDNINYQLECSLNKQILDSQKWDRDVLKQVRYGHYKNRFKIRFKVVANFLRYLPFIIKNHGDRRSSL